MESPRKLKPLNADIIFYEHPSERIQCSTYARNVSRYDLNSLLFYSVFAGPRKDARRRCEQYIVDFRHPQYPEQ